MKNGIEKVKNNPTRSLYLFLVLFTFYLFLFSFSEASAATIGRPMNNDGLVGYWSFDVPTGDGTFVPDKSGSGNNGTLTNATGTENWTDGKVGGGMVFDGPTIASGDYVAVGTAGDFVTATSVTLSAWVNKQGDISGVTGGAGGVVGTMSGHGGYSGDMFTFEVVDSNQGGIARKVFTETSNLSDTQLYSNGTVPDDTWTHIVFTYDGATKKIYINGVLDASESASGMVSSSTLSFVEVQIGHQRGVGNGENYFNGVLDEVRIYNRALSEGEVERLYNFNAPKLGKTPTVISDGLVGHWTFDGGTVTGSSVSDLSGQDNPAAIVSDPSRGVGILGQALEYETDDCLTFSDAPAFQFTDEYTLSAWVKTTATMTNFERIQGVYSLANPRDIDINFWTDNMPHLYDRDDNANAKSVSSNQTINDGAWHLVTGTRNGSLFTIYIDGAYANSLNSGNAADTNTRGWAIGCASRDNTTVGQFFDGSLDDVRIYSRALSADEISRLYNGTKPATASKPQLDDGLVAYYSFDFATDGVTVYDRSGNNRDGLLQNATGTGNWVDGVAGGGAMTFDGDDDVVVVTGIPETSEFTFFAWVKPVTTTCTTNLDCEIVFRPGSTQANLDFDGGTVYRICAGSCVSIDVANIVVDGWQSVAGAMDGTDCILYLNGVERNRGACTGPNALGDTYIGRHSTASRHFNGEIDEVRIYGRALSGEEIMRLHKMGL